MAKAVTAHILKTQLGRILREVGANEQFLVLRRNHPVGIFMGIEDYVRQHPDRYEDVEDFIDTFLEEGDPEFQRSLRKGAREIERGHYLSRSALKLALVNKKLR